MIGGWMTLCESFDLLPIGRIRCKLITGNAAPQSTFFLMRQQDCRGRKYPRFVLLGDTDSMSISNLLL